MSDAPRPRPRVIEDDDEDIVMTEPARRSPSPDPAMQPPAKKAAPATKQGNIGAFFRPLPAQAGALADHLAASSHAPVVRAPITSSPCMCAIRWHSGFGIACAEEDGWPKLPEEDVGDILSMFWCAGCRQRIYGLHEYRPCARGVKIHVFNEERHRENPRRIYARLQPCVGVTAKPAFNLQCAECYHESCMIEWLAHRQLHAHWIDRNNRAIRDVALSRERDHIACFTLNDHEFLLCGKTKLA